MTIEKTVAPSKPSFTGYVSKEPEPMMFDVAFPGGGWTCEGRRNDGRLTWSVPSDQVDRFERHHFFKNGRILKA